ncbi:MAG: type IX secretion system protein PorQ [Psychroflexus sp.]|nr:type IX secretion system protein PorQ [Psychroflexus sp.]MDN6309637.1 type IX secretion system protein PorQ [Psychroflexus sp.]
MKFVFSFVCFFCISFIYAQIGGRTTYEFLNLPVSPRVSALGGKNITLYNDDPSNAIVNPSLVNYKMDNHLSVNYMSYLSDINYGTASYAYLIDRRTQVVHASMTYIDYGSFDGYDENGNSTSSFSGNEASLQFGYATQIGRSDFYAGANMRLITSKLEQYSSFAASVDLGVSYIYEDWDLIVSGVIRNAGYQFKAYDEMREDLPFEVVLGISQMLKNVPIRWHLTYDHAQIWNVAFGNTNRDEVDLEGNITADDPGFFNNVLRHTIVGVEIFPEGGFNIQLGYNFRRGEELRIDDQRAFAGLSGGFSIRFNKWRFSYAYSRFNRAGASSFFGLNLEL